jgi:hypothetical protein
LQQLCKSRLIWRPSHAWYRQEDFLHLQDEQAEPKNR